jgi:hypothetical protein
MAPGVCGELQRAGVTRVNQRFELWSDDTWIETEMEQATGKLLEQDDLRQRIEDYLNDSIRQAFPEFMEEGVQGTATYRVREGLISADLNERFIKNESEPWGAELPENVATEIKRIGAERAEVTFDGYGDSGDIDYIFFRWPKDSDPEAEVRSEESIQAAERVVSDFVVDQINRHSPGWENNEGAFGRVMLVPGEEADFEFNYRVEDSRLHQITIDPETGACQHGGPAFGG